MATNRNLTPEQEAALDEEIKAVKTPDTAETGFWDSFLIGVGDVLAGGKGADAVREYQKETRTYNEKARTKYEEKIAELKKRALEKADRDYADPTTPVSAKRAEIEAGKLYELGNKYLDMANKPHLKKMWTPELAGTFVRNRSAKDIDTDNVSLTNATVSAINNLINQDNELAKADKALAKEDAKANQDLVKRQRELANAYDRHPVKKNWDLVNENYNKFMKIYQTSSGGMRDVSAIYSFVKAADPNSAVKEGEIRLTQEASPRLRALADRFNAWIGSGEAKKGSAIPDEVLIDIKTQMDEIRKGQEESLNTIKDEYRARADAEGIDPNLVIVDTEAYRAKKGGGKKDAAGLLNKVKF